MDVETGSRDEDVVLHTLAQALGGIDATAGGTAATYAAEQAVKALAEAGYLIVSTNTEAMSKTAFAALHTSLHWRVQRGIQTPTVCEVASDLQRMGFAMVDLAPPR